MNNTIKASVAAAVVLMGMAPSAFAGAQVDNKSLTDVLVAKGILTKNEAKAVTNNNNHKLKLEATLFWSTIRDKYTDTSSLTNITDGLNVDRAYLTGKYFFNDDWMARVTTDVQYEGATVPALKRHQNIFLKYAYVQGKLYGDAAVLRLGQSHTPWIDKEEGLWQHRYVENTMIDKYGFDNSADLGLGLKGKVMNGLINYFVTETDGKGYGGGNPTTGNKGLDFDARVGVDPMPGMTVDVQFRDGYKGTKTYLASVASPGTQSTLFQGMITYGNHKQWRVGANYMLNRDKYNVASATFSNHGGNVPSGFANAAAGGAAVGDKLTSTGWDVWGYYNIPGTSFGGFGRYERLINQATQAGVTSAKEKIDHYVLGAEYHAVKGVDFSLVWDETKLGDYAGGLIAGLQNEKDTRFGLYSQVNF